MMLVNSAICHVGLKVFYCYLRMKFEIRKPQGEHHDELGPDKHFFVGLLSEDMKLENNLNHP